VASTDFLWADALNCFFVGYAVAKTAAADYFRVTAAQ
jgi:hypothetical protein